MSDRDGPADMARGGVCGLGVELLRMPAAPTGGRRAAPDLKDSAVSVRRTIAAVVAAGLLPVSAVSAGPVPVLNPDVVPAPVQDAIGCDPLDPALCLLPFPNDKFTVADPTTATGRRINFLPTAMPRNGTDATAGEVGGEGKPMDPTEWNRNDGFSPGQAVLTVVPGIDLPRTWGTQDRARSTVGLNQPGYFDHRDQITDIGLSLDVENAPMVIINARTGEAHPFWSELDTHAEVTDDRRALILRPARNFDEGERYIVALRKLRRADGSIIPAGAHFAAYRDGTATDARAAHMNKLLTTLRAAGVGTKDMYLAWDFTVASERNLSERILTMRDDAFGRILGDTNLADRVVQGTAPKFVIDSQTPRTDTWTDSRGVQRTQQLRRVTGRVEVPNYLDRVQQVEGGVRAQSLPYDAPVPGSRLYDDPVDADTLPDQNPAVPTVMVPFTCDVPLGQGPTYGTLYGHGLLGDRGQLGDVKWPRRFGFNGCALDWWGMSTVDLPTVAAILGDLSNFPSLPDRAQQGFLNWMVFGRALVHPQGLVSNAAFQENGQPLVVVDRGEGTKLYYDGNSQGGIMGGPLVAVSPDISRGILGVTGMNYSTLLNRSVDWEGAYAVAYYATYQDPVERQLGFQLLQMLWDRGESNGYAQHMSDDPLPNTPPHDVMLQVAYSDHQVANVTAEVQARTMGAPIMEGLADGRHWDFKPLEPRGQYPAQGSALVYWDSGNATPPNGNVPPTHGGDPHGHPRSDPAAGWQEAHFLLTGEMLDVCDGRPYLTRNHPQSGGQFCREPEFAPGA